MHRAGLAFASMSQNNNNLTFYAGIDIAKATLELSVGGASSSLANDPKGHARILKLLAAAEAARPGYKIHVILEATGGYEAALVEALHGAGLRLSVIQPSRVRHFANAKNKHAKTDPIDAAVLAAFGEAIQPPPTPPPSAAQTHLVKLVGRRAQLLDTRTAELNRAAHYSDKLLRTQSRQLLALLTRQIAQCDRAIAAQLAADEAMKARAERVQQVPGIGPVVAAVLQAHMPELGSLSEGKPLRWPAWRLIIETAARAKAPGASGVDALPCAAPSTWPRSAPCATTPSCATSMPGSVRPAKNPSSR